MSRKRKIQIHVVAALVVVVLIGWIIFLYADEHQKEKGQENYILTMYDAALATLSVPLDQFDEAATPADQLSCLEVIVDELQHLSAYIDITYGFIDVSSPPLYVEIESIATLLIQGGTISGHSIAPFSEDGLISKEEAAVIQLLKEEIEKLRNDMTELDKDGVSYEYVLSPDEVYQRLTTIIENVQTRLIGASQ